MNRYRYWDILEELPEGWQIDKTAGSPAPNTVFITNGKGILTGEQKRALLKVKPKFDIDMKNEMPIVEKFLVTGTPADKTETIVFPVKTVKVHTENILTLFG